MTCMSLDEIYTPLEEAKAEIRRRWNDAELKKKVEKFVGSKVPDHLDSTPKACLARDVFSPNVETFEFIKLAREVGLPPLCMEHLDDIFFTINKNKMSLARMSFIGAGNSVDTFDIVNFKANDKKHIHDVCTLWGESLVDFHHKLADFYLNDVEHFDISGWYGERGGCSTRYYPFLLALFIRNGILFENFLDDGREAEFTHNVVIPTFERIVEHFGCKPLIVRISPKDEESSNRWCYYEMSKII